MALGTKTMGWIQLGVGVVVLLSAFTSNITLGFVAIGVLLIAMGYHHAQAKGHKGF